MEPKSIWVMEVEFPNNSFTVNGTFIEQIHKAYINIKDKKFKKELDKYSKSYCVANFGELLKSCNDDLSFEYVYYDGSEFVDSIDMPEICRGDIVAAQITDGFVDSEFTVLINRLIPNNFHFYILGNYHSEGFRFLYGIPVDLDKLPDLISFLK